MRALLLLALILSCFNLTAANKMTVSEFEQEIFRLTNLERTKHGLSKLLPEQGLADLARRHGRNMATQNFFEHKDKQGLEVGGRQKKYYKELMSLSLGENLAFFEHSQRKFSPSKVVDGWMNSPGHRANILDKDFTHLGVAVVLSGNKLYAVQNFGHPVLKLLSALPDSFSRSKIYRLEFVYLGVEDARNLEALLRLPDKNTKVPVSDTMYALGIQPLVITWGEGRHFSIDLPFQYGKGSYRLAFGWGNGHYDSDFEFRVK